MDARVGLDAGGPERPGVITAEEMLRFLDSFIEPRQGKEDP